MIAKRPTVSQQEMKLSESYDSESDVYYVTFSTGEPSIAVEVDDVLLMEVGMFSHSVTGFRIMNFKKHKLAAAKFRQQVAKSFKAALASVNERKLDMPTMAGRVECVLEKVFA